MESSSLSHHDQTQQTQQTQQSKLARKQEAKKLKRQRIIDAGGKRPRKIHRGENEGGQGHQGQGHGQGESGNHKSKKKKKKGSSTGNTNTSNNTSNNTTTNRFGRVMTVTPCPNKPRTSTLSIAIPGSIVSNAQTMELRTYLIGQIARACTIYHVDEIIVFDDNLSQDLKVRHHYNHHHHHRGGDRDRDRERGRDRDKDKDKDSKEDGNNNEQGNKDNNKKTKTTTMMKPSSSTDPHTFMANILQYCECPQYLRRHFFPMHPDLQFAGLLNPLDAPHHVRVLDRCLFRDGVVLDKRGKGTLTGQGTGQGEGEQAGVGGSLVDCGIRGRMVEIDRVLTPGIRCTVQMDMKSYGTPGKKHLTGKVVSPSAPREHDGTYWGYNVRMAPSIKAIFDESPYSNESLDASGSAPGSGSSLNSGSSSGGYDLKIGTSERGDLSVDDGEFGKKLADKIEFISSSLSSPPSPSPSPSSLSSPSSSSFQHALIVFGGVAGIEECVDADETLNISGSDSRNLFDLWLNICEYQGSRTIRTEEAVLIGLSRLCPFLFPIHNRNNDNNITPTTTMKLGEATKLQTVEFSDNEVSDEEET